VGSIPMHFRQGFERMGGQISWSPFFFGVQIVCMKPVKTSQEEASLSQKISDPSFRFKYLILAKSLKLDCLLIRGSQVPILLKIKFLGAAKLSPFRIVGSNSLEGVQGCAWIYMESISAHHLRKSALRR
jgi:hypothetical protein